MTDMSRILLTPVEGGIPFPIPTAKTVIGRGALLQVTDKRVSRNHATLEVNSDGKLVIVPIHSNPCFHKAHIGAPQTMLIKDQPKILEHDSIVALLPDKLAFRIVYLDHQDKPKDKSSDVDITESKRRVADKETPVMKNNKADSRVKRDRVEKVSVKGETMAMPTGKRRVLPDWMVGAGSRVGIGAKQSHSRQAASAKQKATSVKATPKPRAVVNRSPRKPKKHALSDEEEEDFDDEDDDFIDDEDEEDFEDDELVTKKKTKRAPRAAAGRSTRGKRTRDSDDDQGAPKRRPRAASLKKPKYTDDDFVISDDDDMNLGGYSSDDSQPRRRNKSEDSDFILDEDDSGSDWESSAKRNQPKKQFKKGKTTPTPGRRRGVGRPPSTGRRGGGGGGQRKRIRQYSDDEEELSDDDNYVPRVSKRRAAVAAVSRMKQSSDYDDDSFDEPPNRGKPAIKSPRGGGTTGTSPRGRGRPRKQPVVSDNSADEQLDDDDGGSDDGGVNRKAKAKQSCQFGKECYRKNPKHFEEFSHPWIKSPVSDDDSGGESKRNEDEEASGGGRQKRAAALKQQEKFDALRKAAQDNSDEELANGSHGSDIGDDGANDSDYEVDSNDSPIKPNTKEKPAAAVMADNV